MGDKDEVLEAVLKEAVDLVLLICFYMGFSSIFVLFFFSGFWVWDVLSFLNL